jgi:hypothetical protein
MIFSLKEFPWQAALADHGTERSDGDIFARVRDDDGVPQRVAVFGVAATLGNKGKTVIDENGDELGG